jgi:serine/threonine-protein kinase
MSFLQKIADLFKSTPKVDIEKRFEKLKEAISGTMSKFYMARDRTTDQIVGLKVLDLDKTIALEQRFKGLEKPCEGAIAVTLKHPFIVDTYEHGITTRGEQFLVMEYLDGPGVNSLLISRSPLLEGKRVTILRQAAEALAEVHRAGFIHRDVCPRNLVASRDCATTKLIDFGLSLPDEPKFRQPGVRTGTPSYMAPEIVRRRPTSKLVDLFSFGVTAFEICTNSLPWPRGDALDAMQHGSTDPIDIRTLRPDINESLARAIHSCIESNPDRRLESMARFLSIIQGVEHEDQPK